MLEKKIIKIIEIFTLGFLFPILVIYFSLSNYILIFLWIIFLYTLIFLGVTGSFVQYLMAQSYKFAEATILVTLRYLAIPIAAIFGYIIWNEIPTSNQIMGGLIVIGSCLLITYREMKKNKN